MIILEIISIVIVLSLCGYTLYKFIKYLFCKYLFYQELKKFKLDYVKNSIISNDSIKKIPFFGAGFVLSGIPLIKVKIKENYYYFLLDSGASNSLIDAKFNKDLNLGKVRKSRISTNVVTANGNVELKGKTKINISVENLEFVQTFNIYNLEGLTESIEKDQLHFTKGEFNFLPMIGVLGCDFMHKHKWILDFDECVVWAKIK